MSHYLNVIWADYTCLFFCFLINPDSSDTDAYISEYIDSKQTDPEMWKKTTILLSNNMQMTL